MDLVPASICRELPSDRFKKVQIHASAWLEGSSDIHRIVLLYKPYLFNITGEISIFDAKCIKKLYKYRARVLCFWDSIPVITESYAWAHLLAHRLRYVLTRTVGFLDDTLKSFTKEGWAWRQRQPKY